MISVVIMIAKRLAQHLAVCLVDVSYKVVTIHALLHSNVNFLMVIVVVAQQVHL